jgi:hypothetical protein
MDAAFREAAMKLVASGHSEESFAFGALHELFEKLKRVRGIKKRIQAIAAWRASQAGSIQVMGDRRNSIQIVDELITKIALIDRRRHRTRR